MPNILTGFNELILPGLTHANTFQRHKENQSFQVSYVQRLFVLVRYRLAVIDIKPRSDKYRRWFY